MKLTLLIAMTRSLTCSMLCCARATNHLFLTQSSRSIKSTNHELSGHYTADGKLAVSRMVTLRSGAAIPKGFWGLTSDSQLEADYLRFPKWYDTSKLDRWFKS